MGAAASVETGGDPAAGPLAHPSSKMEEARMYFSNEILMRGFWAPIDQDGGGSVTLTGIRNYLRNTNPENVVAIYAGPFMGAFATSTFCLKQAYWTSTGRTQDNDPDTAELQDHEFKLMLKHLFFYHNLYALFGEKCEHHSVISRDMFGEALDELSDESCTLEMLDQKYAALGEKPTFGTYVKTMAETYLSDDSQALHQSALMIEEKLRSGFTSVGRRSFTLAGAAVKDHSSAASNNGAHGHESFSCTWFSCQNIGLWLKQIQDMGVVPFKALIDDIGVTRVVFGQSISDPTTCMMIQWHTDNGQGYMDFEEANCEEGGVLKQAAEEGLIVLPFLHVFANLGSHDGWNSRIRPGDVINFSHFCTKSHVGFADSLQEDVDSNSRESGSLQFFSGRISNGVNKDGDAILTHYTGKDWLSTGAAATAAFIAEPPVKYMISSAVSNMTCKVLATYETFTWLTKA